MNNYQSLLKIKYQHAYYFLLMIISIFLISYFICQKEVYDKLNALGVYKNGYLVINVALNNSDTIMNENTFYLNKKKYYYEIFSLSEILYDYQTFQNYQEISLKIDGKFKENEIVNLTIYYDQEKLGEKIWKLVKEV